MRPPPEDLGLVAGPQGWLADWRAGLSRLVRDVADAVLDPRCAAGEHPLDGLRGPACSDCRSRLGAEALRLRCEACSAGLSDAANSGACGACLARPRRVRVLAARPHRGIARALVLALKAGRREEVASLLAHAAYEDATTRRLLSEADVVVPVPAHPVRRRERGFDPAECLAREIVQIARREGATRLRLRQPLRARSSAGKQSARSAGERRRALRGSLRLRFRAQAMVAGRRVALIDDVVTTGATLAESARLLLQAGARDVTVVAITRAEGILLDAPARLHVPPHARRVR